MKKLELGIRNIKGSILNGCNSENQIYQCLVTSHTHIYSVYTHMHTDTQLTENRRQFKKVYKN